MLILLAAAVTPAVVLAGQEVAYFLRQGYDDGYGDKVMPLLIFLVPAALLAAQVVWAYRTHGARIVTAGVAILFVAAAFGWGLSFASESSTAVLIFIYVIPVQWAAAILSGVGMVMANSSTRTASAL